jgi:hypothetical protein
MGQTQRQLESTPSYYHPHLSRSLYHSLNYLSLVKAQQALLVMTPPLYTHAQHTYSFPACPPPPPPPPRHTPPYLDLHHVSDRDAADGAEIVAVLEDLGAAEAHHEVAARRKHGILLLVEADHALLLFVEAESLWAEEPEGGPEDGHRATEGARTQSKRVGTAR